MSTTHPFAPTILPPTLDALVPRAADMSDILEPAPIHPPDVVEGEPIARAGRVVELAKELHVTLWDCTAGRFAWSYGDCDEIIHIVEGSVVITDQEGATFRLEAGDVAVFRAFTRAVWDVEEYVRKVAVTRNQRTGPHWRVVRKVRHLRKQRQASAWA